MKVGYHAPLPPARSGVADYAALLLQELRRHASVEVNAKRADVHLYQLGNNGLHREIYAKALKTPGVILLHDAVLHHFLLGTLPREAYIDEFVYNYGEWMRGRAQQLWEGRGRSGAEAEYFSYPMLRRVGERSIGALVHNPRAASLLKAHAPGLTVHEIPHLWAPAPCCEVEALRLRTALGLRPGELLAGVFGFLRESKRVLPCLRAVAKCREQGLAIRLLLAGEAVSSDLERALRPWLDLPWVVRRPYLGESEFWVYAEAVDVCLNLRSPSAGETSGMVIRFLGIGKPVLVTEGAENGGYPAGSILPVPSGPLEEDYLSEALRWLAEHPVRAREIGQTGREGVGEHHSIHKVALQVASILQKYVS